MFVFSRETEGLREEGRQWRLLQAGTSWGSGNPRTSKKMYFLVALAGRFEVNVCQ